MSDLERLVIRWGEPAVWAVAGVMLLARYQRHPRAARRGLAAVVLWLGLVLPLTLWAVYFQGLLRPYRVYQTVFVVSHTLAYLLLAWAAVTDRPPPATAD